MFRGFEFQAVKVASNAAVAVTEVEHTRHLAAKSSTRFSATPIWARHPALRGHCLPLPLSKMIGMPLRCYIAEQEMNKGPNTALATLLMTIYNEDGEIGLPPCAAGNRDAIIANADFSPLSVVKVEAYFGFCMHIQNLIRRAQADYAGPEGAMAPDEVVRGITKASWRDLRRKWKADSTAKLRELVAAEAGDELSDRLSWGMPGGKQ